MMLKAVDEMYEFDYGFDTRISLLPSAQGCLGSYLLLFVFINRPASHICTVSLVFLHIIYLVAQPTCMLLLSISGKLICQLMKGMHFHLLFNAFKV